MSEGQARNWQSKRDEYRALLAVAKTCEYPSEAERNKELDRLGAGIRRYKSLLENPQEVRTKTRIRVQGHRLAERQKQQQQQQTMSHKQSVSFAFEEEGYNEPATVETPAAGAMVQQPPLLTVSEREYYQMKIDALQRKKETNSETTKALMENDRRLEDNNRRLEDNNLFYRKVRMETNQQEDELIADCNAGLQALL